jgi:hypothetical protein
VADREGFNRAIAREKHGVAELQPLHRPNLVGDVKARVDFARESSAGVNEAFVRDAA